MALNCVFILVYLCFIEIESIKIDVCWNNIQEALTLTNKNWNNYNSGEYSINVTNTKLESHQSGVLCPDVDKPELVCIDINQKVDFQTALNSCTTDNPSHSPCCRIWENEWYWLQAEDNTRKLSLKIRRKREKSLEWYEILPILLAVYAVEIVAILVFLLVWRHRFRTNDNTFKTEESVSDRESVGEELSISGENSDSRERFITTFGQVNRDIRKPKLPLKPKQSLNTSHDTSQSSNPPYDTSQSSDPSYDTSQSLNPSYDTSQSLNPSYDASQSEPGIVTSSERTSSKKSNRSYRLEQSDNNGCVTIETSDSKCQIHLDDLKKKAALKKPPPLPSKRKGVPLFRKSLFTEMHTTKLKTTPIKSDIAKGKHKNNLNVEKETCSKPGDLHTVEEKEIEHNKFGSKVPPPVPGKSKKKSSVSQEKTEKPETEEFFEEMKEVRRKILTPGLTLHTSIRTDVVNETQVISTNAIYIEEDEMEEETTHTDGEGSDSDSLKSVHSYLDMNRLDLKKPCARRSKKDSTGADDADSDQEDYEKMNKLCEYRTKTERDTNSQIVPRRQGKVFKSEKATKDKTREESKVSRIFCSPEPYVYEINKGDYSAVLNTIRGSEARNRVIWNLKTKNGDFNYLTKGDNESCSSDLGHSTEGQEPHVISIYFDVASRTDSIGGCSDLARLSYISALDGIYRTSASNYTSDGSINYTYTLNGQHEDIKRVSRNLLQMDNATPRQFFPQDNNMSSLTLDSGLSMEPDGIPSTMASRKRVHVNISEVTQKDQLKIIEDKVKADDNMRMGVEKNCQARSSKLFIQSTPRVHPTSSLKPENAEYINYKDVQCNRK